MVLLRRPQGHRRGDGTNYKTFYTLAPVAIGGIIARDKNGTKYWYHFNRLGNVMAVTDSNGDLLVGYTMDAFGNVLEKATSTGYLSEHATDPQPYHLTAKEYDADAGLYYFNARWYDHATGRFVSLDPIGQTVAAEDVRRNAAPALLNGYAVVRNNPLHFVDPSGATVDHLDSVCACDDAKKAMEPHVIGNNKMKRCLARCWSECGTDCIISRGCEAGI